MIGRKFLFKCEGDGTSEQQLNIKISLNVDVSGSYFSDGCLVQLWAEQYNCEYLVNYDDFKYISSIVLERN